MTYERFLHIKYDSINASHNLVGYALGKKLTGSDGNKVSKLFNSEITLRKLERYSLTAREVSFCSGNPPKRKRPSIFNCIAKQGKSILELRETIKNQATDGDNRSRFPIGSFGQPCTSDIPSRIKKYPSDNLSSDEGVACKFLK